MPALTPGRIRHTVSFTLAHPPGSAEEADFLAAAARLADVCMTVGLRSVGSFTTSFGRMYGLSPTAYRAMYPPASDRARVPTCVLRAWGRPWTARPRA